ncbi:MAG: sigma-54 dependent transcriptional regulator [Planctomycetota bacterium]|nr:sigma-54 dependent transcriptional regulator [Planctomycetota bacterium]
MMKEINQSQHLANQRLAARMVVFPAIIYESIAMQEVMAMVNKVAPSDSPVVILGETGTGKEIIARTIHLSSPRKQIPLLPVNCASLSESLLESELFGHEKGSFTGAHQQHIGLFEIAHQGTLFLDEIGEMSPAIQSHLLRVLETGEFRRIGGKKTLYTNVRIITATNNDLYQKITEKTFRQDLYYRLNTLVIHLPPLRKRKEDICLLAEYFLSIISKGMGKKKHLAPECRLLLEQYPWPGNVRELRSTIERLSLLVESEEIRVSDLSAVGLFREDRQPDSPLLPLSEMEKQHILRCLVRTKNNRREAAKILEISEPTLYRKIKEYRIQ